MELLKSVELKDDLKVGRAVTVIEFGFRIVLVIFAIMDIVLDDFIEVHQASVLYHSLMTLAISFIPDVIRKTTRLKTIPEFRYLFLIFIFISQFLGEIFNFFMKIWWWDKFAHLISAFVITIIGYVIIYVYLYIEKGEKADAKFAVLATIFAFSFSIMIETMWEIFEYIMDVSFGLNMQKSGLVDTMEDLIVSFIGSLIPCAMYLYDRKYSKKSIVTRAIIKYLSRSQ